LLLKKVCGLRRIHCAACSGITVRLTPESLCGIKRILQLTNDKDKLKELLDKNLEIIDRLEHELNKRK
jgi:hypothetical protein